MASLVPKLFRHFLKIRYLIVGSTVGGGISLKYRYEEWKSNLPDIKWIESLAEVANGIDKRHVMNTLKCKIQDLDPFLDQTKTQFSTFSSWFSKRLDHAIQQKRISQSTGGTFHSSQESSSSPSMELNKLNLHIMGGSKIRNNDNDTGEDTLNSQRYRDMIDKLNGARDELVKTQARYQKKLEIIEKENAELKKQLLLGLAKNTSQKHSKKSLIDMYSDVLDELSGYDYSYKTGDSLPRVVVIGDQSAGKTSVLEMIAQARIFPRGAGEMMTRAPVSVTLSEGPYHIARFKDSSREFDLNNAKDLQDLRNEVEKRMLNSVQFGKTISKNPISMVVQGPGLQRMVLVDLPGIISTITTGMDPSSKEQIKSLASNYMSNPNAIILCIQDASVDAERSNVVDLISEMDPQGKRTIFVLTKVDLAEKNNINPERIERILSGKLFPMKALGYFAVVTGKGSINESIQDIKRHEDEYFSHSKLFKNSISPSQTTTRNLSYAVSDRFWKMVHDTIEQQADAFKATRFNLETEWKNNFPRMRELDRNELFEKARGDILDEVVNLSLVPARHWENMINGKLWKKIAPYVFENIYLPATQSRFSESSGTISQKNSKGIFNTTVDIRLKQWADTNLGNICVEVGWEVLSNQFSQLIEKHKNSPDHDKIFDNLKYAVVSEAIKRHRWEVKASDALRLIQLNTLEDNTVHDKEQWDSSIRFLESALNEKLKIVQDQLHEQIGPSYFERLLHWKSSTEAHGVNTKIISELQKLFHKTQHTPQLSNEEISIVKRNLMNDGIEANDVMIKNVWNPLFRKHLLEKAVQRCGDCKKGFFAYSKGISTEYDCSDVVLFWRVQQMLKITANNLRQQVINRESKRFERVIKEVLEEFSQSSEQKKSLLSGRRVQLVEELKLVRHIQEKLEDFIYSLNAGQE
ncbi:dynamin-like GTPase OPA1, mitochondrial [Lepeophtheirus salmonis]|uniref:dynamin-like GTPase OPA1, mitochondrial n=1 Tax=Lepeophtheirus salmonis TaxID=72036 RepID=UPI001AE374C1|nr:dynamin-like 120 kDa protein, mitochondrial [Lepeophtheirus salmonis]